MANIDSSLFPLFATEVDNQCAQLAAAMLQIEHDPHHGETLDSMMRAAHAMKGAARVVGLDCAVDLTHSMEDYFTAAIQQNIEVGSDGIDALLHAVDTLQGMAQLQAHDVEAWLSQQAEHVLCLAKDLNQLSQGKAVAPREEHTQESKLSANTAPKTATEPSPNQLGQSLRLPRKVLDMMMSLAGESQLSSHQLNPIRLALFQMRKSVLQSEVMLNRMQDRASSVLEGNVFTYKQQLYDMRSMRENLNQYYRILSEQSTALDIQQRQAASIADRLHNHLVESRMQPFSDMLPALQRISRDLARDLGKNVQLEVRGESTLIDRDIAEHMHAPLQHLMRNALDHGIESEAQRLAQGKDKQATITLEVRHHGGMLMIRLSDDGRGIALSSLRQRIISKGMSTESLTNAMSDDEILEFLFLPRFSMRDEVSEVSGRGAGLDLVATTIRQLRGRIQVKNQAGKGLCFAIRLPLTLSVLPALLIEIKAQLYALPLARIARVEHCKSSDIQSTEGRQYIQYQGKNVGLLQASQVFGMADSKASEHHEVVILGDQQHYGFVVDKIIREDRILEKPLDPRLGKVENISAGSVMPDGRIALILDVDDILHEMHKLVSSGNVRRVERESTLQHEVKRILVVDDSITVREAERRLLANHGYQVNVAVDGMDGWNALRAQTYDLLVTDIDMPRMDGIELVNLVRSDHRLNELPIIVVSYKDNAEDRLRGLEAGADAYLTKSSFHDDSFMQSVVDMVGKPA